MINKNNARKHEKCKLSGKKNQNSDNMKWSTVQNYKKRYLYSIGRLKKANLIS